MSLMWNGNTRHLMQTTRVWLMTKHHDHFMTSQTQCSLCKCIFYVIFLGTYQSVNLMETLLLTLDLTWNNDTEGLFTVFFFLWKTLARQKSFLGSLKGLFNIFEKKSMHIFLNKSGRSEHVSHMTNQLIVSEQVMWLIVTLQLFCLDNSSRILPVLLLLLLQTYVS